MGSGGASAGQSPGTEPGGGTGGGGGSGWKRGTVPHEVVLRWDTEQTLRIGRGVTLYVSALLEPRVRDIVGGTVPQPDLEWCTGDRRVLRFEDTDLAQATGKGACEIWVRVRGTDVESHKRR